AGAMRTLIVSFLVVVAGCGGSGQVQGPFTGAARRFYVTRLMLPQDRTEFAEDLNGDGRVDNQLGNIRGGIAEYDADNRHVDEIIAADPAPMIVEIVSDDPSLREDDTVGVRWIGGNGAADQLGAVLHDGALKSNRVTTTQAHATLKVPLFADADPGALTIDHYQLDLAPDGEGGFVGLLDGASAPVDVLDELAPGLIQMVRNDARPACIYWFDANRDGMITLDEIASTGLVR